MRLRIVQRISQLTSRVRMHFEERFAWLNAPPFAQSAYHASRGVVRRAGQFGHPGQLAVVEAGYYAAHGSEEGFDEAGGFRFAKTSLGRADRQELPQRGA